MVFRKVRDPKCGIFLRIKIVHEKLLKNHEEQILFTSGYAFVEAARAVMHWFLNWPDWSLEEDGEVEDSRKPKGLRIPLPTADSLPGLEFLSLECRSFAICYNTTSQRKNVKAIF